MPEAPSISSAEVLAKLRSILAGEEFQVDPKFRYGPDCSLMKLHCQDMTLLIFVDAGELDYVDSATTPDGRSGDYDQWGSPLYEGPDPIDSLSPEEQQTLLRLWQQRS